MSDTYFYVQTDHKHADWSVLKKHLQIEIVRQRNHVLGGWIMTPNGPTEFRYGDYIVVTPDERAFVLTPLEFGDTFIPFRMPEVRIDGRVRVFTRWPNRRMLWDHQKRSLWLRWVQEREIKYWSDRSQKHIEQTVLGESGRERKTAAERIADLESGIRAALNCLALPDPNTAAVFLRNALRKK